MNVAYELWEGERVLLYHYFWLRAVPFIKLRTSLEEHPQGEKTWNTENWDGMDRRFPHWDLDVWECPPPMASG